MPTDRALVITENLTLDGVIDLEAGCGSVPASSC
jgi:hypothetical protein